MMWKMAIYVLAPESSTHLDRHYLRHVWAGGHSDDSQWVSVCYFCETGTTSVHQRCTAHTPLYIVSALMMVV